MKGIEKIEAGKLFPLAGETRTRGHSLKMKDGVEEELLHPKRCESVEFPAQ